MAKRQILIYLDNLAPGAEISWLVLDQRGHAGPVYRGDLKTAANHASGCHVVVMLPGQEILLTSIDIPAMNRQRLMRAVPFALEEAIATDLEDMHFATGGRDVFGRLCVAACDRLQLGNWVEVLREAGINADVLVPALLGVRGEADRWRVIVESRPDDADGLIMLRQGSGGMSFERNNLEVVLQLAIEQCDKDKLPRSIEFVQLNSELSSDYALEQGEGGPEAGNGRESISDDETKIQPYISDKPNDELDQSEQPTQQISQFERGESLSDYVRQQAPGASARLQVMQVGSQDLSYRDIEPVGSLSANEETPAGAFTAAKSDIPHSQYQQRLDNQMAQLITPEIQALCEENRIGLEYSSGDFTSLTYMAAQSLTRYDVNLLQGEFSRKEQLERVLRPWIPAAAVAAIWLLVQGGLFTSHYFEMRSKEQQLMHRMDEVFAEAFPKAKKTKFHLKEMKNRLAGLKREDVVVGGFIPLLHQTGEVLSATKEAKVTAMRFKNEKIDITMEISDLQALDALKEKLINKAQLKVEILSATSRDGKVSSRIQVERQS